MITIKQGSMIDYIFIFGANRTLLYDLQMTAASESGFILIAYLESEPAGFACVSIKKQDVHISLLFVKKEYSNKGVCCQMIEYIKHDRRTINKTIIVNMSQKYPEYIKMTHILQKSGFLLNTKVHIFSGVREDFIHWKEYMSSRGKKLTDYLERKGYCSVSFKDAPKELMDQLQYSSSNQFGNRLDITYFLENESAHTAYDMSYMSYREGKVCAYIVVCVPEDKTAVFEQISVSESYITTGIILLPFAKAMEKFDEYNFKRARYAIYETNRPSLNFQNSLLKLVTSEETISYNYIYKENM